MDTQFFNDIQQQNCSQLHNDTVSLKYQLKLIYVQVRLDDLERTQNGYSPA